MVPADRGRWIEDLREHWGGALSHVYRLHEESAASPAIEDPQPVLLVVGEEYSLLARVLMERHRRGRSTALLFSSFADLPAGTLPGEQEFEIAAVSDFVRASSSILTSAGAISVLRTEDDEWNPWHVLRRTTFSLGSRHFFAAIDHLDDQVREIVEEFRHRLGMQLATGPGPAGKNSLPSGGFFAHRDEARILRRGRHIIVRTLVRGADGSGIDPDALDRVASRWAARYPDLGDPAAEVREWKTPWGDTDHRVRDLLSEVSEILAARSADRETPTPAAEHLRGEIKNLVAVLEAGGGPEQLLARYRSLVSSLAGTRSESLAPGEYGDALHGELVSAAALLHKAVTTISPGVFRAIRFRWGVRHQTRKLAGVIFDRYVSDRVAGEQAVLLEDLSAAIAEFSERIERNVSRRQRVDDEFARSEIVQRERGLTANEILDRGPEAMSRIPERLSPDDEIIAELGESAEDTTWVDTSDELQAIGFLPDALVPLAAIGTTAFQQLFRELQRRIFGTSRETPVDYYRPQHQTLLHPGESRQVVTMRRNHLLSDGASPAAASAPDDPFYLIRSTSPLEDAIRESLAALSVGSVIVASMESAATYARYPELFRVMFQPRDGIALSRLLAREGGPDLVDQLSHWIVQKTAGDAGASSPAPGSELSIEERFRHVVSQRAGDSGTPLAIGESHVWGTVTISMSGDDIMLELVNGQDPGFFPPLVREDERAIVPRELQSGTLFRLFRERDTLFPAFVNARLDDILISDETGSRYGEAFVTLSGGHHFRMAWDV